MSQLRIDCDSGKNSANERLSGFTLIEMAIAILILSIVAAIGVRVAWDETPDRTKVQTCAQTIRTELRLLQTQARTTKLFHRMVFSTTQDRVTTEKESGGTWTNIDTKDVSCDLTSTNLAADTVVFNALGFPFEDNWLPTSPPASPIATDRSINLKASPTSAETAAITINSGTGLLE